MLNNIKITFFGTSDFSVFCLEEMKILDLIPELIITSPDKPIGRGLKLEANPVKIWAEQNNISYLTPLKLDSDFILHLTPSNCNLFIVASYGKIIPKTVLDLSKHGTINIHPSLLPKYRGPSPLQSQIVNNESDIGFSIMLLDEQMDHGPIITQEKLASKWPVSLTNLKKIMAKESTKKLVEILPDWIEGKIEAKSQNHTQATFTKKIEKKDGELDIINDDPYKNYLKFLAYGVSPRVYAFAEKKSNLIRFIITDAEFKDGQFIIKSVLPEGKKEMNYDDFLRGLK